tara:strand:+ start:5172 stop:5387 length:216 start_codon:yes stop_codon:yes gene_type:complete
MTVEELKRINEVFYAVKGHLFPIGYSLHEMRVVYDSYFKRLWGNHEAMPNAKEDFEKAWANRTTWLHEIED